MAICQSLIFVLLFSTIINGSEDRGKKCDVAVFGEFEPEDWIRESTRQIQGLCPDSYFKVDIVQDPNSEIFWILGSYFKFRYLGRQVQ